MLDRKHRSLEVVIDHDIDVLQPEVAADERNGDRTRRGSDHLGGQPRTGQDDTVGAQLQKLLEGAFLRGWVPIAGGDQRPVAALGGGRIESIQDLGEKMLCRSETITPTL